MLNDELRPSDSILTANYVQSRDDHINQIMMGVYDDYPAPIASSVFWCILDNKQ